MLSYRPYSLALVALLVLVACAVGLPQPAPKPPVISPENVAKLGQIALWERGTFQAVAWLPDGKTLAVSSSIGVYFLDAATLNQVRFIRMGMQPWSFTVSPDGQLLALLSQVECEEKIQLWNESGFLFPPQRLRMCSAPWQIWDVNTGELLYTLDPVSRVMSMAFSPDGHMLATSGSYECPQSGLCKEYGIRLWDARTGQPLRTIESYSGSIAFSPDGSTLALWGVDLQLWDVTTGQLQRTLQVDEGPFFPSSFAFNPNGRTLALGEGTIQLWNVASGQLLLKEGNQFASMAFSPDGNILALGRCPRRGGGGADIAIFDAKTGKYLRVFDTKERCALSLAFNPIITDDGIGRHMLALIDYENVLALYDMATGKRSAIEGKWGKRDSLLSPDGQTFVSTDGYNLWVWSTGTGQLVHTFQEQERIYRKAYSADGHALVALTWDDRIHIWDVKSGQLLHELDELHVADKIAVSRDERTLVAVTNEGAVDVWDMDSGKPPHTFTSTQHVTDLALTVDGRVLALRTMADYTRPKDDELQLWDTNSGQMLRSLEGASGGIDGFAFSPDGNLLAAWRACDLVKVWDVKSGRLAHTLGTSDCVTTLAFAPDGRILAAGTKSGVILLWDVSHDHLARRLEGHEAPILGIAFGEDGRKLVSLSQDDTVRVWGVTASTISR